MVGHAVEQPKMILLPSLKSMTWVVRFRLMIVRLLQKIGKELMKKCEAHIDVDRVFSGYIISTKRNIEESIKLVHIITLIDVVVYKYMI